MKKKNLIVGLLSATALTSVVMAASLADVPDYSNQGGGRSNSQPMDLYMYSHGVGYSIQGNTPQNQGGQEIINNQQTKTQDYTLDQILPGTQWYHKQLHIPTSAVHVTLTTGQAEMVKRLAPNMSGGPATDVSDTITHIIAGNARVGLENSPEQKMKAAQAGAQAQATDAGNAMADTAKNQAASAIGFCASYLNNFTVTPGNKWNQLRDTIFVPMAILLLLPGAVLTQARAMVAHGSPVLGEINPFEGILRSIIAIFMIPGTYLVVNYTIDLSNSITYTINSEYQRLFGTNMYYDATCAEIRAFPARQAAENRNALDKPTANMTPILGSTTALGQFEGKMIESKIEDPSVGLNQAPQDRPDESLPAGAVAARLMMNSSNAMVAMSWNVLCAFQMAFMYYLWFVGPIMAALWVWPMKQLRSALPNWIEGVITLGFWSLFWNTVILLMACFKGVDETGTVVMSALNFLATASVKFAFDFAGLVKAAGQEAGSQIEKAMKQGASGGGAGGGAGAGRHSSQGSHSRHPSSGAAARHADAKAAVLGPDGGAGGGARLACGPNPGGEGPGAGVGMHGSTDAASKTAASSSSGRSLLDQLASQAMLGESNFKNMGALLAHGTMPPLTGDQEGAQKRDGIAAAGHIAPGAINQSDVHTQMLADGCLKPPPITACSPQSEAAPAAEHDLGKDRSLVGAAQFAAMGLSAVSHALNSEHGVAAIAVGVAASVAQGLGTVGQAVSAELGVAAGLVGGALHAPAVSGQATGQQHAESEANACVSGTVLGTNHGQGLLAALHSMDHAASGASVLASVHNADHAASGATATLHPTAGTFLADHLSALAPQGLTLAGVGINGADGPDGLHGASHLGLAGLQGEAGDDGGTQLVWQMSAAGETLAGASSLASAAVDGQVGALSGPPVAGESTSSLHSVSADAQHLLAGQGVSPVLESAAAHSATMGSLIEHNANAVLHPNLEQHPLTQHPELLARGLEMHPVAAITDLPHSGLPAGPSLLLSADQQLAHSRDTAAGDQHHYNSNITDGTTHLNSNELNSTYSADFTHNLSAYNFSTEATTLNTDNTTFSRDGLITDASFNAVQGSEGGLNAFSGVPIAGAEPGMPLALDQLNTLGKDTTVDITSTGTIPPVSVELAGGAGSDMLAASSQGPALFGKDDAGEVMPTYSPESVYGAQASLSQSERDNITANHTADQAWSAADQHHASHAMQAAQAQEMISALQHVPQAQDMHVAQQHEMHVPQAQDMHAPQASGQDMFNSQPVLYREALEGPVPVYDPALNAQTATPQLHSNTETASSWDVSYNTHDSSTYSSQTVADGSAYNSVNDFAAHTHTGSDSASHYANNEAAPVYNSFAEFATSQHSSNEWSTASLEQSSGTALFGKDATGDVVPNYSQESVYSAASALSAFEPQALSTSEQFSVANYVQEHSLPAQSQEIYAPNSQEMSVAHHQEVHAAHPQEMQAAQTSGQEMFSSQPVLYREALDGPVPVYDPALNSQTAAPQLHGNTDSGATAWDVSYHTQENSIYPSQAQTDSPAYSSVTDNAAQTYTSSDSALYYNNETAAVYNSFADSATSQNNYTGSSERGTAVAEQSSGTALFGKDATGDVVPSYSQESVYSAASALSAFEPQALGSEHSLPAAQHTQEPGWASHQQETHVSQPQEMYASHQQEAHVSQPQEINASHQQETHVSQPQEMYASHQQETHVSQPQEMQAAQPVAQDMFNSQPVLYREAIDGPVPVYDPALNAQTAAPQMQSSADATESSSWSYSASEPVTTNSADVSSYPSYPNTADITTYTNDAPVYNAYSESAPTYSSGYSISEAGVMQPEQSSGPALFGRDVTGDVVPTYSSDSVYSGNYDMSTDNITNNTYGSDVDAVHLSQVVENHGPVQADSMPDFPWRTEEENTLACVNLDDQLKDLSSEGSYVTPAAAMLSKLRHSANVMPLPAQQTPVCQREQTQHQKASRLANVLGRANSQRHGQSSYQAAAVSSAWHSDPPPNSQMQGSLQELAGPNQRPVRCKNRSESEEQDFLQRLEAMTPSSV